jgi:hypothetical protein
VLTHSRVESANEGVQPAVQELLAAAFVGEMEGTMSLVRLLGFTTLSCGCVVGRYREVATSREVTYVEEKARRATRTAIAVITRWSPNGR